MIEKIRNTFLQNFGRVPSVVVRSPGRINLIGEHTDYNKGFVLPAAINKSILFSFGFRNDNEAHLHAFNLDDSFSFRIGDYVKSGKKWPNYIMGVMQQLELKGLHLKGFNCAFGGDLPIGAGLSSSAALEGGMIFGLSKLFNLSLTSIEMALAGQASENYFVGVQCGIMDQFANVFGKADHVIRLDCRNHQYEYVPFKPGEYDIVLCNTGVKHSLAGSEYNTRRKECETGVTAMKKLNPEISSLRDATLRHLESVKNDVDENVYKRCKFVIEEIERVKLACDDLKKNDIISFGRKMYATHDGLQHLYNVSCKELDFLVDEARKNFAVIGSRMMGGGFGGCTINMVRKDGTAHFVSAITEAYYSSFGKTPACYIVSITNGIELIHQSVSEKIN